MFAPLPVLPGTSDPPLDCATARQVGYPQGEGHGRLEERVLTVSSALQDYSNWPYLAQVFQ